MIDVMACMNTVMGVERALAPYDTGNLMNNGIHNSESVVFGTATFWVNFHGNAPYGVILNEAMYIRRNGKPVANIHYMWHDKAFYYGCLMMAAEIGGQFV